MRKLKNPYFNIFSSKRKRGQRWQKYTHDDLLTVFLRTGGSFPEDLPSVYQTRDGKYYLIAAQGVDPDEVGLGNAVKKGQKLIMIPKRLVDSNFLSQD